MRLVARAETIRSRLGQREIGSDLEWHRRRNAESARATPREPVDAGRSASAIARDALARAGWFRR